VLYQQLGYDPEADTYPRWLASQPYSFMLPSIKAPGTPVAFLKEDIRVQYGNFKKEKNTKTNSPFMIQ
jgi:hypothetical protein